MDVITNKQKTPTAHKKQRSYNEIIEYLNNHWHVAPDKTLTRMNRINALFDHPSQKVPAIVATGTNGKSLTLYFAAKLLEEEGLTVSSLYSPHILTYNERFSINQANIQNKQFTALGNYVIDALEQENIQPHTREVLTVMSFLHAIQNNADVMLLEAAEGGCDPTAICDIKAVSVTRITQHNINTNEEALQQNIDDAMQLVRPGTYAASGDQNKAHLQRMHTLTTEKGGNWIMPIRKLAPLHYPYEQLHGRCAALAERLAHAFMNYYIAPNTTIVSDSLLIKQKGQRGRPTLEAKRQAELHPKKTIEQFWKDTINTLPGRFQLLDKEKPSILLDNAGNIDAFKNVMLGIRLLHYQRSLKGLAIIISATKDTLHNEEFLKLVRYFFKKTAGQLFICPINDEVPGTGEDTSWNVNQVTNDIKTMKIKAKACKSFDDAYAAATKHVDERDGLIVITGSQSIIKEYWKHKGIKKLS
jgi:dihydrofolate synthase/folylpolyglutamate synthase